MRIETIFYILAETKEINVFKDFNTMLNSGYSLPTDKTVKIVFLDYIVNNEEILKEYDIEINGKFYTYAEFIETL